MTETWQCFERACFGDTDQSSTTFSAQLTPLCLQNLSAYFASRSAKKDTRAAGAQPQQQPSGPMNSTPRNPRHIHADADVRVVIEDMHFDVHLQVMAIYSEYFRALFDGPWRANHTEDDSLRFVEPGDIVTATEFELFFDYIYQQAKGKELAVSAENVVELEAAARALHVAALQTAVKKLYATNPMVATWQNVEMLLEKATSRQLPLDYTRAHCIRFLSAATGAHWVRVWYLAEQYELPELTDDPEHYCHLPHDPWNDPFFAKLSDKLRSALLLARMRNGVLDVQFWHHQNHCAHSAYLLPVFQQPMRNLHVGENVLSNLCPCQQSLGRMVITVAGAPAALTSASIAATEETAEVPA
ncbi:hypothetical protein HDU87_002768 [Geranomyces variabilis]|uniref:BTB domain-containing protein n=1 Tax=Geranomyces variabilis TaxID=109894 RepID=A0AAD5TLP2_9FUNG|nr:hypothetical protein HDU87_002768 [Geranomyces variabilis]